MAQKRPAPAKKKKRGWGSCLTALTILFSLASVFCLIMIFVFFQLVVTYSKQVPDITQLPAAKETTKILSADGQELANLYLENREYARISEIPGMLQLAFIAVEDQRFFNHGGFDVRGTARSLYNDLVLHKPAQGGSTITQQLARTVYLTQEKTISRKIKELIISLALERRFTKEEILENYMNRIYLGSGSHGVRTAARVYFGKKLEELTPAECAMLASLAKSPSAYSPFNNPTGAMLRRNVVLRKMRELNLITDSDHQKSVNEPLTLAEHTAPGYASFKSPFFVTYVMDSLTEENSEIRLGSAGQKLTQSDLYTGGYRIFTTLDTKMQKAAEEAVQYGLDMGRKRRVVMRQGALVAMEPETGYVRALVGGANFEESKYNRAWQAKRQPGSSFKPFVYITALKNGYSMNSTVMDNRVCYPSIPKPYCPRNYDNSFHGGMSFSTALIYSRNVPAVKVAQLVGIENVIDTAHEMGIASALPPVLSTALGSGEVSPLEMATAYSSLANGGHRVRPVVITRIENTQGAVLYEYTPHKGPKVLEDGVLARIIPVMEGVITRGTGAGANIGRPAAGKTGTTSEYKDAWFVGFVPQLTAAVWFGNDDNIPLRAMSGGRPVGAGIAGGTVPAPVWKYFMERALRKIEKKDFEFPEGTELPVAEHRPRWDRGTGGERVRGATATNEPEISGDRTNAIEPEVLDFAGRDGANTEDLEFTDQQPAPKPIPEDQRY